MNTYFLTVMYFINKLSGLHEKFTVQIKIRRKNKNMNFYQSAFSKIV